MVVTDGNFGRSGCCGGGAGRHFERFLGVGYFECREDGGFGLRFRLIGASGIAHLPPNQKPENKTHEYCLHLGMPTSESTWMPTAESLKLSANNR